MIGSADTVDLKNIARVYSQQNKGETMGNTNEMQMVSDNHIILTDAINESLHSITENHQIVSDIPTPKAYVKKKMG